MDHSSHCHVNGRLLVPKEALVYCFSLLRLAAEDTLSTPIMVSLSGSGCCRRQRKERTPLGNASTLSQNSNPPPDAPGNFKKHLEPIHPCLLWLTENLALHDTLSCQLICGPIKLLVRWFSQLLHLVSA